MATTWKKYQAGQYYNYDNGMKASIIKKTYSAINVGSCDYWVLVIDGERVGRHNTMKGCKKIYDRMV